MATIRITNLKLRTIIGIHDWERAHKQDVIINVTIEFDASKAADSDNIDDINPAYFKKTNIEK